jgi:hypothetical protein
MGGVGGLVSSAQPQAIEKPMSDGPLGNAAAAGGITQTEIIDGGQTEAQPVQGQDAGGIASPVLPATDGPDTRNVGLPGAELPADASGEATSEIPLATQQAPSPAGYDLDNAWLESAQNFTNQEGHILHGKAHPRGFFSLPI